LGPGTALRELNHPSDVLLVAHDSIVDKPFFPTDDAMGKSRLSLPISSRANLTSFRIRLAEKPRSTCHSGKV
jgi:hypothetical protein